MIMMATFNHNDKSKKKMMIMMMVMMKSVITIARKHDGKIVATDGR